MVEVSVKDARANFRTYLDRAEAGEEIIITRRGREVARLVPPRREPKTFADLTEFRKSTRRPGESPMESLLKLCKETRYSTTSIPVWSSPTTWTRPPASAFRKRTGATRILFE